MRLILTSFNPQVHHKILARPKPVRAISPANQRRLVAVVSHSGGFGHVGAFFGAGVVGCGHNLQSPVHSTDLSIVGSPNKSNCPAACVASAFLALAQN